MTSSPQPQPQPETRGGRPRSTLLIPTKRALLPPCSTSPSFRGVHRTLNPSAVPAQIQIRRPAFSTVTVTPTATATAAGAKDAPTQNTGQDQGQRHEPTVIEFDASRPPQPFLDPGVLQRMRAHVRAVREVREGTSGGATGGTMTPTGIRAEELKGEGESEEAIRRRQEREAEYGSMAVRGRSRGSRRRGVS